MLELMRKKAQSWMIKVLFAVIIIVFIFFYGYGTKSGRDNVIAHVNGTKIMQSRLRLEYQKAYQNLARLYQSIYGDQFDPGLINDVELRGRVLNDLIDETLMMQEAERLSLQVSPQEMQVAVHSNPAFQVDGKFDGQRFRAILQVNQISVDEFQEIERRNRMITKLRDLISLGAVELSDQEVLDAYSIENEKVNLEFVRLNPTDHEDSVSAEDAELETYFSKNSALFETPPRVQVQYIVFAPEDFLEEVEIPSEEIREEYDYNLETFRIPKRVKVSHILVTPGEDNGDKAIEEAKREAEQILEKAKGGEDFVALAKAHSKDPGSAKDGGSIGWVIEGGNTPEFAKVAFSLENGEIAPLVESENGFHIVKVDDVQEEKIKSLEEVEGQIRAALAEARSRELAEAAAQEAFFAVYEDKNLERYAAEHEMALVTTGLFSRAEKIKEVGETPEFNDHAFSLEEGEVSPPVRIGGKEYLINLVKRESSRVPALEEVKEKVREAVVREKAVERARVSAEEILEEIKAGKPMSESAEARGLKVEETGLFERGGSFVPRVGPTQELGEEIYSVSQGDPLLERVVSYGKVFFVMALKEEQKVDVEKFESEKEEYKKTLNTRKRAGILQKWLASFREESEIKINEQNLGF
jgi:peptidyl-prolyl cis-trans isomerase D